MWEVDGNFAARFILAPGELPSGTVVAVGNEGGAEQHTLTADEGAVGDHRHVVGRFKADSGTEGNDAYLLKGSSTATGNSRGVFGEGSSVSELPVEDSTLVGEWINTSAAGGLEDTDPHNNMPPWRAAYVIQRSARIYHTVP
jgi:hypothetical protein